MEKHDGQEISTRVGELEAAISSARKIHPGDDKLLDVIPMDYVPKNVNWFSVGKYLREKYGEIEGGFISAFFEEEEFFRSIKDSGNRRKMTEQLAERVARVANIDWFNSKEPSYKMYRKLKNLVDQRQQLLGSGQTDLFFLETWDDFLNIRKEKNTVPSRDETDIDNTKIDIAMGRMHKSDFFYEGHTVRHVADKLVSSALLHKDLLRRNFPKPTERRAVTSGVGIQAQSYIEECFLSAVENLQAPDTTKLDMWDMDVVPIGEKIVNGSAGKYYVFNPRQYN